MSLEGWLERNLGFEVPRPGLQRIQKAIELFCLEFSQKKIITIGGTNGKGETARELYRLGLQKEKCALWTSPHLVSVRERFSLNGELAQEPALAELFVSTREKLLEADLKLSYYEFLFLAFLRFSASARCLVLEVGLGGRFDAVNALDADVVLLTSISRDHQEYLGNRLDGILAEKIALARKGKKLVTNFELSYLRRLAKAHCSKVGIEFLDLYEEGASSAGNSFSDNNRKLASYCAAEIFGEGLEAEEARNSFPLLSFEYEGALCHGLTAHNPDGVRKGVQFLNDAKYTNSYKLVLLSFSNRRPEDAMAMIKTIKLWSKRVGANAEVVISAFDHPKAMGPVELKSLARQAQVKYFDDTKNLFKTYKLAGENVLVLGSNYFIGRLCEQSGFAGR